MSGIDPLHMPFHDSENAGPADATHPMHKTYASKVWIVGLVLYSIVVLLISIALLGHCLSKLLDIDPSLGTTKSTSANGPSGPAAGSGAAQPTGAAGSTQGQPTGQAGPSGPQTGREGPTGTEAAGQAGGTGGKQAKDKAIEQEKKKRQALRDWEVFLFWAAVAAGLLGGALHLASSLGKFVGARRFLRSWGIFYILRPLVSAGLGVFFLLVLKAGFVSEEVAKQRENLFVILLFCGLGGLFSRQAMDKLAEIFDSMFRTSEPKTQPPPSVMTGSTDTGADLATPLRPTGIPPAESFEKEERIEPPKE